VADPETPSLAAWSRVHAVLMLAAALAAAVVRHPAPAALLAAPSFAWLLWRERGRYTAARGFGAANVVTLLRLALILLLSLVLHRGAGVVLGTLVFVIFALDGVDGWLARRQKLSSEFGAHFDMETDALFVLALGLELWLGQAYGAWILVTGPLRYLYVLSLDLLPSTRGDMPRSKLGRRAFVALITGFGLAFLLPRPYGPLAAAIGSALVAYSFGRSFWWSYGAVSGGQRG
jgi:phosphatidylglycerophosphate synthase